MEDADPGSPPRANHGSGIQTEKQVKPDPVVSNKHSHDPERWPDHNETPILCLAGRGPLDEAASSMLAQLLEKHGFRAIVAPYAAASRETIARLETKGVRMVCISYLEVSGNPRIYDTRSDDCGRSCRAAPFWSAYGQQLMQH